MDSLFEYQSQSKNDLKLSHRLQNRKNKIKRMIKDISNEYESRGESSRGKRSKLSMYGTNRFSNNIHCQSIGRIQSNEDNRVLKGRKGFRNCSSLD